MYGASLPQHRIARFTTNADDSCKLCPTRICHAETLSVSACWVLQSCNTSNDRGLPTRKIPPTTSYAYAQAKRPAALQPAGVLRHRYLEVPSKGTSCATSLTIVSMACSRMPWRFCAPDWPPSLWNSLTAWCEMPAPVSSTAWAHSQSGAVLLSPDSHPLAVLLIQPNIAPPRAHAWPR